MEHERPSSNEGAHPQIIPNKKMKEDNNLPPELWSQILHFLSFDDVLSCTSINHFFHCDVPAHVKQLSIQEGRSMTVSTAATDRFNNVTNISIINMAEQFRIVDSDDQYSYDSDGDGMKTIYHFHSEIAENSIQFILRFPKLTNVDGLCNQFDFLKPVSNFEDMGAAVCSYAIFVRHLCEAFQAREINFDLELNGILPPDDAGWCGWLEYEISIPSHRSDVECQMCDLICTSFPPKKVVQFTDGEIPCIHRDDRLKIARARDPYNFRQNLTEALVFELHQHCNWFPIWAWGPGQTEEDAKFRYEKKVLDALQKLVEYGANAEDERLRPLLVNRPESWVNASGKKSMSLDLFHKLEQLGFNILRQDFNMVENFWRDDF